MQLSCAACFLLSGLVSILVYALSPSQQQLSGTARFVAWVAVIAFLSLTLVMAVGSYFGWRRMFRWALVLIGLSAIGGAINTYQTLAHLDSGRIPAWNLVLNLVFWLVSVGLFVWMWRGNSIYGPWATYKRRTQSQQT
jgi:hypothetical protein